VKQLKQIEMERNVLSSGLDMVEQTRRAYFRKIAELDARRKCLNDAPVSEVNNANFSRSAYLSVSLSVYLRNHMSELNQIFCACGLACSRGSVLLWLYCNIFT